MHALKPVLAFAVGGFLTLVPAADRGLPTLTDAPPEEYSSVPLLVQGSDVGIAKSAESVTAEMSYARDEASGLEEDYCWPCAEFHTQCDRLEDWDVEFLPEVEAYCAANPTHSFWFHGFYTDAGPCTQGGGGGSETLGGGEGLDWKCRACGWTTDCHTKFDFGMCHAECQWGGDPDLALRVEEAVQATDGALLVQLLREHPLAIRVAEHAAALEVSTDCSRDRRSRIALSGPLAEVVIRSLPES